MESKIIEILKLQNNMFDFEIIRILIEQFEVPINSKEFHKRTSTWFQFELDFVRKLEELGITFTTDVFHDGPYYSYRYRLSI